MSAAGQSITDDTLLWSVRERARGVSVRSLASRLGVTEVFIRVATNRVKKDDLAGLSGDARDRAARFYWPDRGRRHG